MKIVSKEELRALEIENANRYGIDEWLLQEHAAIALYLAVEDEFGAVNGKNILVISGKGNNGGDALASARNFIESGANVSVLLAFGEPVGKAQKHFSILKKMGVPIETYDKSKSSTLAKMIKNSDIVIDGILGIGVSNLLSDDLLNLISLINENSKFTVSVDIPSGIEPNTGNILGGCVKADLTVTFGLLKTGMLFYPAREMCGKVKIGKIGIPETLVKEAKLRGELTTFEDAKRLLPKRPQFSHKGTFGKVAIIAGSRRYTGAPVLTAYGALRVGAGLVTVGVPEPFNNIVTSTLPEAISIPLSATQDGFLAVKSRQSIEKLIEESDAIAVGPGLGTNFETAEVVKWIVSNFNKPLILDADALNLLSKDVDGVVFSNKMAITPHPGEFARLTSKNVSEILSNPVKHALEFSQSKNVNVLLKGATTVVASPDGKYFLNVTGNSGLATGGSGDILTGVIVGFVAQKMDMVNALKLAAYVHGRSAEVYAENNSEASLIPRDLADYIPKILKGLS